MNNLLDVLTREGVLINVSVRYWRGGSSRRHFEQTGFRTLLA